MRITFRNRGNRGAGRGCWAAGAVPAGRFGALLHGAERAVRARLGQRVLAHVFDLSEREEPVGEGVGGKRERLATGGQRDGDGARRRLTLT